MSRKYIVKQVYNELLRLSEQGFSTWVGDIYKMAENYNLDLSADSKSFSNAYKTIIEKYYIDSWNKDMNDLLKYPILRTYRLFKESFRQEKYLSLCCENKYIRAIAHLRTSSHTLAIERGRHERPKLPIEERLCRLCGIVEDEAHFVTECIINEAERKKLFENIASIDPMFLALRNSEKMIYLLQNEDSTVLTWLGRFLFKSFMKRNHDNLEQS